MNRAIHVFIVIQLIVMACATTYFLALALVDPPKDRPPIKKGHRL